MTPFAIAGVQMHVAALTDNIDAMAHRLEVLFARYPWVQMVLFSELCVHGPLLQFAQPFPNDAEMRFQELARHYGIWLIPGSMFEQAEDGRIYNTASVINPQGEVVTRHRKMFPFRPLEVGVTGGGRVLHFRRAGGRSFRAVDLL